MLDARLLTTEREDDLPPPTSDETQGTADVPQEALVPSQAAREREAASGGWLEMSLLTRPHDRDRFAQLSGAIADAPEAAANYLFRGELLLKRRLYAEAYDDLNRALDLAKRALAGANWGLMDQVVQDRAAAGLNTLSRYITVDEDEG